MSEIEIKRLEPMRQIDPLTGQPWAHPWRHRVLTRQEFEGRYGELPPPAQAAAQCEIWRNPC